MTVVEAARRQLGKVADELETLELTMLGIQGTLPASSAEAEKLVDVEVMDAPTELRAVIGCVVHDYIGPAQRSIRDALAETESAPKAGDTKP
jgi:CHAD domain-containing protein